MGIDRGKVGIGNANRKWHELPNRSRVYLATKMADVRIYFRTYLYICLRALHMIMAEAAHFDGHFIEQVSDVLETIGTGVFCNTFSERGKRQNEEVQRFKEAVHAKENEENFCLFCKDLIQCIGSCIAATTVRGSVVCGFKKGEIISAVLCKKLSQLKNYWDAFRMALHLPQPDPVWMQTDC